MAEITIDDLKFDNHNFNKHTENGLKLLQKSILQNKFGRSIVVDKDNNIIAGNGIIECAKALNKTNLKIVETNGDEIVVVKRNDLTIDSQQGRNLALADNATASVDLNWDFDELAKASEEWGIIPDDWGVEIPSMEDPKPKKDLSNELNQEYKIEISFNSEEEMETLYNQLVNDGYECRILTL